jgi:hypothetical protein
MRIGAMRKCPCQGKWQDNPLSRGTGYRFKNSRGGTAFANLVWKPKVLIEMKKCGANLADHLQQAFDYWTRKRWDAEKVTHIDLHRP